MRNSLAAIQNTVTNPFSIVLSLMDACWIYVVAWLFGNILLISRTLYFVVPQPVLLALFEFGGLVLTTYLFRRSLSNVTLRLIVGAVGLVVAGVTALAHTPLDTRNLGVIFFVAYFYIFFLVLVVWMLGSYRAAEPDSYERAYRHFRLGIAVIAISALFATVLLSGDMGFVWSQLWGSVLLFFGAGLGALALGNRDTVRRETGDANLRSWAPMLVVAIGLILLLGVLAQGLGAGDIVGTIQAGVLGVLTVIGGVFYLITLIVLWPFTFCNIKPFEGPDAPPTASGTTVPNVLPNLEQFQRENQGFNPLNIPEAWRAFFIILAALLVVAAVLYFALRWVRNTRPDVREQFEEEHERFGSWELLLTQLRAWLDRLLSRFRKPVPVPVPAEEDDLAILRGRADMAGTLTIRQVYARLLADAHKKGYPRAAYQTPNEYLRILSNALPHLRPQFEVITAAYLDARYSSYPASTLSVSSANEAWRQIEASGIGQPT